MDTITTLALSIDNPVVKIIGMALDNSLFFAFLALSAVFIGEKRQGKRAKIIVSVLLALILAFALKSAFAHDRPCLGESWCPESYSFPSLHAAVAFALMIGFLDKRSYPFFLLFALFVSFSRMNLGVHTFLDIAGALPVALISYYLTDLVWREKDGS